MVMAYSEYTYHAAGVEIPRCFPRCDCRSPLRNLERAQAAGVSYAISADPIGDRDHPKNGAKGATRGKMLGKCVS